MMNNTRMEGIEKSVPFIIDTKHKSRPPVTNISGGLSS